MVNDFVLVSADIACTYLVKVYEEASPFVSKCGALMGGSSSVEPDILKSMTPVVSNNNSLSILD